MGQTGLVGNDIQGVVLGAVGQIPPNRLFDGEVEELLQEDRPGIEYNSLVGQRSSIFFKLAHYPVFLQEPSCRPALGLGQEVGVEVFAGDDGLALGVHGQRQALAKLA